MKQIRFCIFIIFFNLILLSACSNPLPDEQQIRNAIDQIQRASDDKKLAQLMHYFHKEFIGRRHMSRRDFQAHIFYHFQANPRVRVYVSNIEIRIEEKMALVSCHILVTGSQKTLPNKGRLYRIDSAWQKQNGEWWVKQADWDDVVEELVR